MKENDPPSDPLRTVYKPLEQGVLRNQNSLEISIFSSKADSIFFQIFSEDQKEKIQTIPLAKSKDNLFTASIPLPDPNLPYLYIIDSVHVMDPYTKAVTPSFSRSAPYTSLGRFTFDHFFDWQGIKPPSIPLKEMIIYETHIRGFTNDPSSKTTTSGTYSAMIEKIPHLKRLGINTVELMPPQQFDDKEQPFYNPKNGKKLVNYWGYNTTNFFCPNMQYAASKERLAPITEFKTLIRELHREGIQVILDVVYNHVSPQMGLENIDKGEYFILSPTGEHTNYSGCGNTINANSNASMNLILSSLKYFAEEFHVDGFRYDLGGCLMRGKDGSVLENPPLFQQIASDEVLSKLIHTAEPWDAAGLNCLGNLGGSLFLEWDGEYKHAIRKFINHYQNDQNAFTQALLGNPHVFEGKKDLTTQIHYITIHDGLTLGDLVSYNEKHNHENGEENLDGDGFNFSNNYGAEGDTEDPHILETRKVVMKNFIIANLFSRSIPIIAMGDEYGRSAKGNNNTYCHDNELNWFNWDLLQKNLEQSEFVTRLCQLRTKYISKAQNATALIELDRVVAISYDDQALVAFNMSEQPIDLSEKVSGEWKCEISSMSHDSLLLQPNASLIAIRVD